MKKILFITTNDWIVWGGSEDLWFETAKICIEKGFEVGISIKKRHPMPEKLSTLKYSKNLKYFLKEEPSYSFREKITKRILPSRLKMVKDPSFKDEILKWKPDLVVVSQGNNRDGLEIMEFFSNHTIRFVTISQAVYEGIWPTTEIATRMRIVYNKALANYFVSEANLNTTTLQIGESVPRSKIVRNPYNVVYHNELPFPETKHQTLACVARFEFYAKGQDVLLQVLNNKKWKERDLLINFYGSGINEEGIKRLIKYFDLKNVSVKGFAPTMHIWKENQGLILPSRFEGLPLALVEAMLCGRVSIVTNVSGNKEVIVDDVNGFLAEAPQAEYLDNAMERAWKKRAEWQEIGDRAKQYIKTLVSSNPANDFVNEINRFIN